MKGARSRGKICLIALDNKRNTDLTAVSSLISSLAKRGYYCDKISKVAFNRSEDIVNAFEDGIKNYDNIIILCPVSMQKTIGDFFCSRLGSSFDALGVMNGVDTTVFMLFDNCENRLKTDDIKKILDGKYNLKYESTVVRAVGAPKKLLEEALKKASKLFPDGGAFFNVTNVYDDIRIEIVYDSATPKIALDEGVREIVKILSDYIYALEDITLAEQLIRLLKLRRMKICTAESFTGGGVGKKLVSVSGASEVYCEGLNTYSNSSKTARLGVSELTLSQRGAVSAETAYQMAEGLYDGKTCNVAVSTTGIAGPKSDNTSKPVGLAFIGVGVDGDISVYKFNFHGDRKTITETAINHALFLTYKKLK